MLGAHASNLPGRRPFITNGVLRVGITESIATTDIVLGGTTIWGENTPYNWNFSPGQLSVVSTLAVDTAGGTGARSLYIGGLDADFNSISEIIPMAGLTPSVTTKTFARVNEMFVTESGSLTWNSGIIRASIGGSVVARIDAATSRSNQCTWTVPGDWKQGAVLLRYWSDMSNKQTAVAVSRLKFKLPDSNTWQLLGGFATGSSSGVADYISQVPLPIPPKTDLQGVLTDLSTSGVSVVSTMEFIRFDS